jgi:hypothetical protein
MLNLHNTETGEYMETIANEERSRSLLTRLFQELAATSTFDSGQALRFSDRPDHTTNSLYRETRIPVVLLEQRISTSPKLGRRLTVADRLDFGKRLIAQMGHAVLRGP